MFAAIEGAKRDTVVDHNKHSMQAFACHDGISVLVTPFPNWIHKRPRKKQQCEQTTPSASASVRPRCPRESRRFFIGSPIRRSGPECSPSVIQRVASVVRRSASCYPSFAEEEQSEDIIMQKPFKSCRGSRRRRPAWASEGARRTEATAARSFYYRFRRSDGEEVGLRARLPGPRVWGPTPAPGRMGSGPVAARTPVPRQRAAATEERLPADRRRRRRRPR